MHPNGADVPATKTALARRRFYERMLHPRSLSAGTMTFESLHVNADDDTPLATYRWRASGRARAIIILVHGMAEHARRYDRFATALAAHGLDIHAFDLRGHGATAARLDHGLIEAQPLWPALLADVARIRRHALDVVGRRPVFLFGHSLGSSIVQGVVASHGARYAGAILCGTDRPHRLTCHLGALIASVETVRVEVTGISPLLQWLSLGSYNRALKRRIGAVTTPFDWLSSDPEAVARYQADPDCGFALRAGTWRSVLRGIAATHTPHNRRMIPPDLPLLITAGQMDPMGQFGRGPARLARGLNNDGQRQVTLYLYADARHELLHERVADTVTADIRAWLDTRLAEPRALEAAAAEE